MKSESLVDVYTSMFQIVGEFTTHRIMFAAGEKIGGGMVKNRELNDPKIFMEVLKDHMQKERLGEISYELVQKKNVPAGDYPIEIIIHLFNSPLTELPGQKKPQCSFIRGVLRGAYSEFSKWRDVSVTETKCIAAGCDHCEFEIKRGPGNY
ncbi:MAG: V4R domain-containing protein [Candidatus Micrarchaeota archaeon]